MELRKNILLFLVFFRCFRRKAQIFSWKNLTSKTDSFKTDSGFIKKIQWNFLKRPINLPSREKILLKSVLIKENSRSQIFGDLNAKGSIIRGITFGNNQRDNLYNLLWICKLGEKLKMFLSSPVFQTIIYPFKADGYKTLQEFVNLSSTQH